MTAVASHRRRFSNGRTNALTTSERALNALATWARTIVVNSIVRAVSRSPDPPSTPPASSRSRATSPASADVTPIRAIVATIGRSITLSSRRRGGTVITSSTAAVAAPTPCSAAVKLFGLTMVSLSTRTSPSSGIVVATLRT